jgi:hypothetical protein
VSTVSKRLSASDPLTEHDVAERIDRAAMRLLRMLGDVREADGDLFDDVRRSRYHSNALDLLAEEIALWRSL